jgi:hypothetical protein
MRRKLAAVAFACALSSGIAHADDAATKSAIRELGEQGVSAYEAGRYDEAHTKLTRAYELSPLPTLGLWRARALEKLGRWVEASELYLQVTLLNVEKDPRGVHAQAKRDAETERGRLLPKIPKLIVQVDGVPPDQVELVLDNKPLPSGLVGVERPTDPGPHTLTARSGERSVTRQVSLAEGQVERVSIALEAEPQPKAKTPAAPPAPSNTPPAGPVEPAEHTDSGPPALAWIALSIGGAGLAVGTITGVMALSMQSQLEEDCEDAECEPAFHDDVDSYNRLRTISFVSLGIGAVGVGTGLVLLGTSSASERGGTGVEPIIGLGSAGVRGRF